MIAESSPRKRRAELRPTRGGLSQRLLHFRARAMARVALASSPWRPHATPALMGGMGSRLARVRRASAPCPPPHVRGRHATPDNNFLTWCEENFERGLLKEYVDPDRGPTEVTRGSHYRALGKCAACGYEWRAMVNYRTIHAQGMPGVLGPSRQLDEQLRRVVREERRAREETPR